jgi:2,5-diketo-D-gluconate reductase A
MTTIPAHLLSDGRSIPAIGFGTYRVHTDAVHSAIDAGYRLIDTALNYKNEAEVGAGIRASGIPRDELFVTTKLPGRHHGYDEAMGSLAESLANLGLDYVDLYLIHWPLPRIDKFVDTWRAMIAMRDAGLTRSIGVSNFTAEHLARLIDETGVAPVVNQIELHPHFSQTQLRALDAEHGILTESWSPLGRRSELLGNEIITRIAAEQGVTPAQVVLRWHIQLGSVPIPRSADPERQRQNLDVFGFELTDAHMAEISSLQSGRLWDGDPDTHEEF